MAIQFSKNIYAHHPVQKRSKFAPKRDENTPPLLEKDFYDSLLAGFYQFIPKKYKTLT
jgi:hypothetical protein